MDPPKNASSQFSICSSAGKAGGHWRGIPPARLPPPPAAGRAQPGRDPHRSMAQRHNSNIYMEALILYTGWLTIWRGIYILTERES